MANVQVLVEAEVLGTPISGGYQKTADGTSMVVYGKADVDAPPKSIQDFMDEFQGVNATDITGALPDSEGGGEQPTSVLDTITISLKQVYLLKRTTGATTETLYSVWILLNTEELTRGFPIQVKTVSLKLWTDSVPQSIKDAMEITAMQRLLGSI